MKNSGIFNVKIPEFQVAFIKASQQGVPRREAVFKI